MSDFNVPQQRYSQSQSWSATGQNGFLNSTAATAGLSERVSFIRKVYALFFVGILFAIGGVMLGFLFPPLMIGVLQHPWITFFALMGGVILAQAVRHQPGINLLALFGFTSMTGVMISPLLYLIGRQNPISIVEAGVLSVGIFGGLTAYVFISKRDFSFLGGMVTTGLIVVVLASLLNIFLGSGGLGFAIAAACLLLFAGFILYDTSNIIRRYPTNEYVAGALSLYLDAFNLFLALLRILNSGRR
jgi:FtsH-binding integral membrane protein